MNTRTPLIASALLASSLVSGVAHAALQGRDLNGSAGSFEAYYDTELNITWLADANVNGPMAWAAAKTWAANLNIVDTVNNITYDNWRLPTVTDTGTSGCNFAFTGTDCGYNVNTASSEMAHLFYDEMGWLAMYNTAGMPQQDPLVIGHGPFLQNMQAYKYWSGTGSALNTNDAWTFDFGTGYQNVYPAVINLKFFALAVSPGDVAAVPEADTWAMLLAGLGLIGVATWRRKPAKV
jgi:hypothetical protein